MAWISLKKGGASLHVAYAHTFTNNLYAYDAKFRAVPSFEISLDLNPNLRTRNKTTNTYIDARDLADGEINELELLQIDDEGLLDKLAAAIQSTGRSPADWTLTVELGEQHSFRVKPESDASGRTLYLRVLSRVPQS